MNSETCWCFLLKSHKSIPFLSIKTNIKCIYIYISLYLCKPVDILQRPLRVVTTTSGVWQQVASVRPDTARKIPVVLILPFIISQERFLVY